MLIVLSAKSNSAHPFTSSASFSQKTANNLDLFLGNEARNNPKHLNRDTFDSIFKPGSGIDIKSLTGKQIENLTVLSKIWGFLKYFHPEVAKGKYNWDIELFKLLPKILYSRNKQKRSQIISDWIKGLGKVDPCSFCFEPKGNVKLSSDFRWMEDQKLFSEQLISELVYIKKNRNQNKNLYISAEGTGNPIFTNEDPYKEMIFPDAGYRILALFRYWNIIEYFFPYKYAIGNDWNTILPEFIPKFIEAKDSLEYRLIALELTSRINDTHGIIYGNKILFEYFGAFRPPFTASFVEGKPVVTQFYHTDSVLVSPIKKGDIILKVNGIGIDEILKEKWPITPASNEPTKFRNIAFDLLRSRRNIIKLDVLRNGNVHCFEIYCSKEIITKNEEGDSSYRFINNEIAYISMRKIRNESLPIIMNSFKNTKGIILDLRKGSPSKLVYSLGEYLMPKPTEFVSFTRVDLSYPGTFYFYPTLPLKVGVVNNDYYKGKIIILVNENTQSAGEFHAMSYRVAPNATVIGSTTAGADGNVSELVLPGNIRINISGLGVYYPDGRETQRVGIIPDIELKPTIKGIIEGKDELLEKAIEIIYNKQ